MQGKGSRRFYTARRLRRQCSDGAGTHLRPRAGLPQASPWPNFRPSLAPRLRSPRTSASCSLSNSKTGGTSRPRPKSPTVAPSSRRPRHFREGCAKRAAPHVFRLSIAAVQASVFLLAAAGVVRWGVILRSRPTMSRTHRGTRDPPRSSGGCAPAKTDGFGNAPRRRQQCKHCRNRRHVVCCRLPASFSDRRRPRLSARPARRTAVRRPRHAPRSRPFVP